MTDWSTKGFFIIIRMFRLVVESSPSSLSVCLFFSRRRRCSSKVRTQRRLAEKPARSSFPTRWPLPIKARQRLQDRKARQRLHRRRCSEGRCLKKGVVRDAPAAHRARGCKCRGPTSSTSRQRLQMQSPTGYDGGGWLARGWCGSGDRERALRRRGGVDGIPARHHTCTPSCMSQTHNP